MLNRIFANQELNSQICQNGYVVIEEFLNHDEIRRINDLYETTKPATEPVFYTTIWNEDYNYRKRINDELNALYRSRLQELLPDFAIVFSNFIVKSPGGNSNLDLHKDWSFTEEEFFESFNVWVALTDATEQNGCLQAVPKSHRICKNIRGRNIYSPFQQSSELIKKQYLVSMPVKAGCAIIINTALLHASNPNRSDKVRLASSTILTSLKSRLVHYAGQSSISQEIFKTYLVEKDFFVKYPLSKTDLENCENVKLIDTKEVNIPPVDFADFSLKLSALQ